MIWVTAKPKGKRERRRTSRHDIGNMHARVGSGPPARVVDITEESVRLEGAPGWLVAGQRLTLRLIFPTRHKEVHIPVEGVVLRREMSGLVVLYRQPIAGWKNSFHKLVRATPGTDSQPA